MAERETNCDGGLVCPISTDSLDGTIEKCRTDLEDVDPRVAPFGQYCERVRVANQQTHTHPGRLQTGRKAEDERCRVLVGM